MYQPDINTYLEAIRQEFETIKKDNKALKQENSKLIELNNQYYQKMNYYMELAKKNAVVSVKQAPMLKMGSDWSVEGDGIFEVSLGYKLVMEDPISSVAISSDGKMLAFVSGMDVYVVIDRVVYVIENDSQIIPYDKKREKEGQKSKRLRRDSMYQEREGIYPERDYNGSNGFSERNFTPYPGTNSNNFGGYGPGPGNFKQQRGEINKPNGPSFSSKSVYFPADSLFLFISENGGFIRVWDLQNKVLVRTIGLPDPKGVFCTADLTYVISIDRTLRVYDKEKVVMVISTNEDLEGPLFVSQDGEYAYCLGKGSLITFDLNRRSFTSIPLPNDRVTDMAVLSDLGFLCLSSRSSLNFYKTSPTPRFVSSNENEEFNYCSTSFANVLVVGHKKGMSFYDIKNKRKMKINVDGGITYSIDSCNSHIVSVENRTTLRVWKHGDVK